MNAPETCLCNQLRMTRQHIVSTVRMTGLLGVFEKIPFHIRLLFKSIINKQLGEYNFHSLTCLSHGITTVMVLMIYLLLRFYLF